MKFADGSEGLYCICIYWIVVKWGEYIKNLDVERWDRALCLRAFWSFHFNLKLEQQPYLIRGKPMP